MKLFGVVYEALWCLSFSEMIMQHHMESLEKSKTRTFLIKNYFSSLSQVFMSQICYSIFKASWRPIVGHSGYCRVWNWHHLGLFLMTIAHCACPERPITHIAPMPYHFGN